MAPRASNREAGILTLLKNGDRMYGRELRREYEEAFEEELPYGSLYTTLMRLEEKGFIKSKWGESAHERGGNRRKYYKITAPGKKALDDFTARGLQRARRIWGLG